MERRREPPMTAHRLAGYDQAKERTEKALLSLQGATRDLQLRIAKWKEEKEITILSLKGTYHDWRPRMPGWAATPLVEAAAAARNTPRRRERRGVLTARRAEE